MEQPLNLPPAQAGHAWWCHANLATAGALRRRFETATDADDYRDRLGMAQVRSLSGRALLRGLLHQQLGAWWSHAPVTHLASGAPILPDLPGCTINVSHSGDQVAAAACPGVPVGIDIEWVDVNFGMAPVARRFFHPREVRALARMPAQLQRTAFFAWWAAKEAVAKCLQQGLTLPLASFVIPNPLGAGPALGLETPVWVVALPAPPGYRAALAWQGHCRSLPGLAQVDPLQVLQQPSSSKQPIATHTRKGAPR